ncbi:MAG TPA: NAD(P)-dependent oxidoreductase [Gemmatimonadales bacterium]|nr:NAD(P)-dependent oxidoreductase [Gemmatimonadales bacterium]
MAAGLYQELHPLLEEWLAVREADRCLQCGGPTATAPCTLACPAGVDVPGFIAALARRDVETAAALIFAANPLGGTCGRVCPGEELCEGACVLDQQARRPVPITRLQRWAIERALGWSIEQPRRAVGSGKRVTVIGAGPAGLACAAELARLGHAVTVVDARPEVGGLVRYAIAPYRLVRDPLPAEAARLERAGIRFRLGYVVDSPRRLLALARSADAVFLGVGLGKDADVRYPGDDLPGIWDSLPFIEAIKLHQPPAAGERAVVIGGGNTAIDVAREALRLGAREVTLLYRRSAAEMPAYRHEVVEARAEGVTIRFLTEPVRFLGTDRLEAVECRSMRLGEPDRSGRARPEPVPGSEVTIAADIAIKALGQARRTGFFSWIPGLKTEGGLLAVDPATGQTSVPKYFAGGDAVNGGATVVEAVRHGKVAAHGIHRYFAGCGGGTEL